MTDIDIILFINILYILFPNFVSCLVLILICLLTIVHSTYLRPEPKLRGFWEIHRLLKQWEKKNQYRYLQSPYIYDYIYNNYNYVLLTWLIPWILSSTVFRDLIYTFLMSIILTVLTLKALFEQSFEQLLTITTHCRTCITM